MRIYEMISVLKNLPQQAEVYFDATPTISKGKIYKSADEILYNGDSDGESYALIICETQNYQYSDNWKLR